MRHATQTVFSSRTGLPAKVTGADRRAQDLRGKFQDIPKLRHKMRGALKARFQLVDKTSCVAKDVQATVQSLLYHTHPKSNDRSCLL